MNNEFENLSQEARGVIESETYIAKQIIWNFYSRKYGVKFEEFECNEICVNYIEDYLKQRIRPRILKWNRVGDQFIYTGAKQWGTGTARVHPVEGGLQTRLIVGVHVRCQGIHCTMRCGKLINIMSAATRQIKGSDTGCRCAELINVNPYVGSA